ncbi:ester cyclase [Kitasatospora sp. NPDC004240]
MAFVQIIDCKTDKVDELNRLMDTWAEQTRGKRTASHSVVGTDRSDRNHVVEIVEFPSYEEAMRNSNLPETDRIFREMVALCEEPPTFTDLDVVRDAQFNKTSAARVFEEMGKGNTAVIEQMFATDYHDHDFANETDKIGMAAIKAEVEEYLAGFDFTFTMDGMVAEGDQVCCRWTWNARHTGEYRGIPATGKDIVSHGTTTFRFENGMIKEGWWHWDVMSVMRQMGVMPEG